MPYLVGVLVLLSVMLVLGACRRESSTNGPDPVPVVAPVDAPSGPGSRADIAARLKKLADAPPPKELSMGAMCYEMMAPPDRAEYVCPDCGEKTLYATADGDRDAPQFISWTLPACRETVKTVRDLTLVLDESGYCAKCSPDAKKPTLALVVKYPDGTEHRTENVTAEDLIVLREFASGALKHDGGQQGEKPLKKWLPRLRQLLGTPAAE